MASGFFALLDDVAGIAKLAAASLDDVAGTAGRVGLKATGVVIDDTAVTPRYVAGLSPDREWPMIARIGLGSLRNKLLILLPLALLLNVVAPWAVEPLLMLGGCFLCYEGAEKVIESVAGSAHHGAADGVEADPKRLEDGKVKGAIRTDLILSAEIMAISLAEVAERPLWIEAIVLALVGVAMTVGVYGVVALVVKVDDLGLHLARHGGAPIRALGRVLVQAMPPVLRALTVIGTAAMIWVGGGILIHGLQVFGVETPAHILLAVEEAAAGEFPPLFADFTAWAVSALGSGLVGLVVGVLLAGVVAGVKRLRG
jgi:uncharacterized protein